MVGSRDCPLNLFISSVDHVFIKGHDTGCHIFLSNMDALFHRWKRSKALASLPGRCPGGTASTDPAESAALYFLTLIYIVWEHGKKGWYAAGISIILFTIALLSFWPGLFVTYTQTFLPEKIRVLVFDVLRLNSIKDPGISNYSFDRSQSIIPVIGILFQGIRNSLFRL